MNNTFFRYFRLVTIIVFLILVLSWIKKMPDEKRAVNYSTGVLSHTLTATSQAAHNAGFHIVIQYLFIYTIGLKRIGFA